MPRCSNMCASMQLADAYMYDSTYSCSRAMEAVSWKHAASSRTMEACKQNYGSMPQAAEAMQKHGKQQNHGSMQAAEMKDASSSRTMDGSMQAAELCKACRAAGAANRTWKHAASSSSRTMEACKQQNHRL